MTACARTAGAACTAAPTGDNFSIAMRKEYRYTARRMLTLAAFTRNLSIRIFHRPQRFEALLAIQADIFVNWHPVPRIDPILI